MQWIATASAVDINCLCSGKKLPLQQLNSAFYSKWHLDKKTTIICYKKQLSYNDFDDCWSVSNQITHFI